MTAIIGYHDSTQIVVAADTLACRKDEVRTPFNFVSKIFPLPQKNAVIIGVGAFDVLHKWHLIANKNLVAQDIITLNTYSSDAMKHFLIREFGDAYCCIYQLGFDEDGDTHCFKYDSSSQYDSEELPVKIFVRPNINNLDSLMAKYSSNEKIDMAELLFSIMKEQKSQDELNPVGERAGIGGMMEIMIMRKENYSLFKYKMFDDYDSLYDSMLDNCQ